MACSKSNTYGQLPGLYEFLMEAELQQYYSAIKTELKVQSITQLKYVTESDMSQIGMSRPEMRRLIKYFHKHCPQTYLAKMKKKLLHRDDSASIKSIASNYKPYEGGPSARTNGRHIIQADSIVIHKKLGCGEFGTVQQGVWTSDNGERIQVAIKCLTQERMENNPVEFLKEAAIMHSIDHEHIVRLFGVVLDTSALMLVTELAPLRSLLEVIKEPSMRSNLGIPILYEFAVQICDGMQYLESKRLIHRDLAARNILVFSRNKVKISDFGLSRALGVGKDYYQTNFSVNLKLPIAWCAPECINFLRFTSASDVWAFGVVLWEIFSYGFQPWTALTGQQILEAIDEPNYQRLEKPECCPNEIYYQLMLKCWQHDPLSRPTFVQLSCLLPECKPEQVQTIRGRKTKSRREFLEYDVGEIVVVLEKNLQTQSPETLVWKGVLRCGRSGLFYPRDTIAYIGSDLPSLSSTSQSFKRNDYKTSSMRSRLSTDMISVPQGDLKHTGHVGADGEVFGDLGFMSSKNWVPKQVVTPYKPERPSFESISLSREAHFTQQMRNNLRDSEIPSSDTAPLLSDSSQRDISSSSSSQRRRPPPLSLVGLPDPDHEYHEISDEENEMIGRVTLKNKEGVSNPALSSKSQSPLDSPAFEKSFEVGPSLMDEVFEALQDDLQSDNAHNVKNDLREMVTRKKKYATVKPISSSDRRTLEQAIAIANELASRSMLDLDRSGKHFRHKNNSLDDISSPLPSNSPTHRRKFSFVLGQGKHHEKEKRNYSQEAASIPDIQSTLSEEAKEVYNSLIEKTSHDSLGYLTPQSQNKSTSFHFPEKSSSLDKTSELFETTSVLQEQKPLEVSPIKTKVEKTNNPWRNLKTDWTNEGIDEEEEQNPLRLLRMNKRENVLPLPPKNKKPLEVFGGIRHQRKHQLVFSGEGVEGKQNQEQQSSLAERRNPIAPPPKPIRQNLNIKYNEFLENTTEDLGKTTISSALHNNIIYSPPPQKNKEKNSPTDIKFYENCEIDTKSGGFQHPFVNSGNDNSAAEHPKQGSSSNINIRRTSSSSVDNLQNVQKQTIQPDPDGNYEIQDTGTGRKVEENYPQTHTNDTHLNINQDEADLYCSAKVNIIKRILGSSTTEKEASWALEITNGDRAKAVKLLRLKALLPDSIMMNQVPRVISVLSDVHWDVARASDFLLNTPVTPNRRSISKQSSTTADIRNANFNINSGKEGESSSRRGSVENSSTSSETQSVLSDQSSASCFRSTHV